MQCLVFGGVREYFHESQQGSKAHFMVFAGETYFEVGQTGLSPAVPYHFPRYGDLDAEELVSLAILPRSALEKAGEPLYLCRVCVA